MSQYQNRSKRYSVYSSSRHRRPSSRSQPGKRRGQYIDPARFVRAATSAEVEEYVPKNSFADFRVAQLLKGNLAAKGYVTPTPIQDQTIPPALEGQDIIGIANTGTGKTAAFVVPILNKLIMDRNSRALIIAPTRELAQQIQLEFQSIARGSGLFSAVLIGGAAMGPQLRDLRNWPRIVIGTPGRIKDHIERRTLQLSKFNVVVLDEVDRMLDMGFINDVTSILNQVATPRQSFFFSATMDPKVQGLIQAFSSDPTVIRLKASDTSENVHQDVVRYQSIIDKLDKLHNLLLKEEVVKVLVFDETKRSVEKLSKELLGRGFSTDAIHGGKSQAQRQRALNRFKTSQVKVLVATDVAARGIDVADITHVVNYTVPQSYDDYVHRIGRTGRAGQTGYALTFVTA